MVACLLLQMPWNERGRDDAGAGFDRSKRKAAAQGISADCKKRERRRHHAVLGQAARRETDHATLYLRQGEGRQSVAAREARRGRTEWRSLAPAQRLAQAAVGQTRISAASSGVKRVCRTNVGTRLSAVRTTDAAGATSNGGARCASPGRLSRIRGSPILLSSET